MDPQTIEKAIKRCIDISTRLGALEDELPQRRQRHRPVRGRNRRNAAMARWPRVNSPAAGPETAPAAEPHPSPRRGHKHAGSGSRRSERSTTTAPSAAPRSRPCLAGPSMAGTSLPAMANLFAAVGAVSPARAAAPAQDARQRADPVTVVRAKVTLCIVRSYGRRAEMATTDEGYENDNGQVNLDRAEPPRIPENYRAPQYVYVMQCTRAIPVFGRKPGPSAGFQGVRAGETERSVSCFTLSKGVSSGFVAAFRPSAETADR